MSISVDSLNAMYDMNAANSQNTNKLEGALARDYSKATDDELMEVCREFEAYFTEQVFKAMQKMVPKNEEENSGGMSQLKDYYTDMMISEYAKHSSEGQGLGIAQMMYEQMKRNYNL